MAKRILVPLDGTTAAEAVLGLVADVARGAGAVVRLLHVARIPERVVADDGHVVAYADQEMARVETEAADYLASRQLELGEIVSDRVVRFGEPVAGILEEAEAFGADLVALTSGHRRGLGRLLLGSTAEAVCRRTALPVVIVRGGLDGDA
jgi:nucleotide-binding universal stress UspA family protein